MEENEQLTLKFPVPNKALLGELRKATGLFLLLKELAHHQLAGVGLLRQAEPLADTHSLLVSLEPGHLNEAFVAPSAHHLDPARHTLLPV